MLGKWLTGKSWNLMVSYPGSSFGVGSSIDAVRKSAVLPLEEAKVR